MTTTLLALVALPASTMPIFSGRQFVAHPQKRVIDHWQQEKEQSLQAAKDATTSTSRVLKARGITHIEFDYHGNDDNGWINDCRIEGISIVLRSERDQLKNLVYALLLSGWEINDGSEGTVTFDLETGGVSISHKWLEYVEDIAQDGNTRDNVVVDATKI